VQPLIQAEWPGLDAAALAATAGDLEQVTALVAAHADRTKVAIRRALLELFVEATRARTTNGAAHPGVAQVDEALAMLRRFEAFASDEARKVSAKVLPETEARVRKSPWTSLLIALGIGLILGLWLNGRRRG
jgi:ElaB/YqjD/DUF883 family membrane-anchored ribosome-binding protein